MPLGIHRLEYGQTSDSPQDELCWGSSGTEYPRSSPDARGGNERHCGENIHTKQEDFAFFPELPRVLLYLLVDVGGALLRNEFVLRRDAVSHDVCGVGW
jgi:hypothetical protein